MLATAICAFREPFGDGFVEAIYPGQEIDVPDEMVGRLVTEGHIERPAMRDAEAITAGGDGEEAMPRSDAEPAPSRKRK